jgi:triosephosphate isomerase (TIM)
MPRSGKAPVRSLLFAANWKMNVSPAEARDFAARFSALTVPDPERALWFFPPSVSIEATVAGFRTRSDIRVGAQDVHWEPKGAFTGAVSIPLVRAVGATGALVGHSERRHVFGETDQETGRKVRSLVAAGMQPFLCVGEKLAEREAGQTLAVVARQLEAALAGLSAAEVERVIIAYEPVWAIGTGRNATPEDAAQVHRSIRRELARLGSGARARVLYGGSVNQQNVLSLIAQEDIDGVLVGGASLDPEGWAEIVGVGG